MSHRGETRLRWSDLGTPLPYAGPLDNRREHLGAPFETRLCSCDHTGRNRYRFNASGYRGDEFDPGAPIRIVAFGESDAFGLGVDHGLAWPERFAARVRSRLGSTRVSLLNCAEPGGSNALIARTVLGQCRALRPELVLINFADPQRAEGLIDGEAYSIGSWLRSDEARQQIEALPADSPKRTVFFEALERGRHFLDFVNFETARLTTLREVLLVQAFLADAHIGALATIRADFDPCRGNAVADPHLGPMVEQIDRKLLQPHDVGSNAPDRTKDGEHFGPASHEAIADQLFRRAADAGLLDQLERLGAARSRTTGRAGA